MNIAQAGYELSSNECLIAGNAVDYTGLNVEYIEKRNVFVSITGKDLNKNDVVWLTKYTNSSAVTVYTPQLVMWEEYNESTNRLFTKIVTIDSNGNLASNIIKSEMRLSDCKHKRLYQFRFKSGKQILLQGTGLIKR